MIFRYGAGGACALLLTGAALVSGCRQKAAGPAPLYAVVRFENLSGDPGLEWVARGASELLSRTLPGAMDGPVIVNRALVRLNGTLGIRPAAAPGISTESAAAKLAGANRLIYGYIERTGGGVRITSTEEDLETHRTLRTVSVREGSALGALNQMARTLSPKAGAYLTSSEEALRLYSSAREASPETAIPALEQALRADVHFGPAWEALIQNMVAKGDRQGAEVLIAKAREAKPDRLTLANLDVEAAMLRGDAMAQLAALRQVSLLSPSDTVLVRSLAEAETTAGRFADAAADWQRLQELLPGDTEVWNQLGYTRAWSGNYGGAVQAMEGYARLRPAEANPLDSLGDVHFLYRKYAAAANAYGQANTKTPGFLNGGELYKAAWAKFLAGDRAGAEAVFAEFRKTQQKNEAFPLVAAEWLYRTGRRKEALAALRASLEKIPAATKPVAFSQLVVWELLAGDRAAAAKDAAAAGAPATPAAFLTRFVTLPSADAAEWEGRAARMIPAPEAAGLRRLALGYALLLDGKRQAALRVWQEIAAGAPGNDFELRAIYTRLNGEQPKLALLLNPAAVNPFSALAGEW